MELTKTKVRVRRELRAAKGLGLSVPPNLLPTADEVIEYGSNLLHRICPLLAQSGHFATEF